MGVPSTIAIHYAINAIAIYGERERERERERENILPTK